MSVAPPPHFDTSRREQRVINLAAPETLLDYKVSHTLELAPLFHLSLLPNTSMPVMDSLCVQIRLGQLV